MKKKKIIIILLAVIAVVGILVNKGIIGDKDGLSVDVARPIAGQVADSILASGNLVFKTQVQLRSEVTGRVVEVLVEEGETVNKGDVLMRLDTRAIEAEVQRNQAIVTASELDIKRAEISLNNIERQLGRNKKMVENGLTDEETFDNLNSQFEIASIDISAKQAQLQQAQASLFIAKDRLNKSVFLAPITGLLASVDIKAGETVIAGTTNIIGSDLMVIADPSAILAELRVNETDISGIKLGQTASVYAAAYPDEPFTGTIINIGTSAKEELGFNGLSFKVKVLLDKTERSLYAGMSCRSQIATSVSSHSLKLPIEAIHQQEDQYFVWTVDANNKVNKQFVTTGIASDIEQAVIAGLSEEDKVVIGPARPVSKLKDGDVVNVKFVEVDNSKVAL